MEVIRTSDRARQRVWSIRSKGSTVGLIPTMGALHDGHLSLVQLCADRCDTSVASIFVNPTQFGPHEDLDKYPRTFDQDCERLEAAGVDFVFAPTAGEMYPNGFSTYVEPPNVACMLEGKCRPGHFRGVTTVVMKLFQILPATHAAFGRKDYQQFKVIEAMTRDLNVGVEIIGGATIREPDGLAMSSRNRYLSSADREQALALSAALQTVQRLVADGEREIKVLETAMRRRLDASVDQIDYAVIVDAETLTSINGLDHPAVALIAAHVGTTRLIDNRELSASPA